MIKGVHLRVGELARPTPLDFKPSALPLPGDLGEANRLSYDLNWRSLLGVEGRSQFWE